MFSKMAYICNNEYDEFFKLPNVTGVGIGHKEINGVDTGEPCLKVFVKEKLPLESLNIQDVIPPMYKGFKTDVRQSGEFVAYAVYTQKVRPTIGGYSIAPVGAGYVGTLGCLVATGSGTNFNEYILSNNHVLANTNTYPIGTQIMQPGTGDGGNPATDVVASLSSFVSISFPGPNSVDCAIANAANTALVSNSIVVVGNIQGIATPIIGSTVQKSGRTTGYTNGTVTSINTTTGVNYGGFGVATFTNQIVTTAMSAGGDSGSVVLDMSNRVIGLLFAGSATDTVINDIRIVLQSFKARLM